MRSVLKTGGAWSIYALALLLLQSVLSPAQAAEKALPPLKIVLVGDSTVAPYGGWGTAFRDLLKPEAQCVNWAFGGRSSKSYRDEGHWKEVLAQKPDYMLIQFGHNDMPGKGPERETDPKTTYAQNMARYVEEARAIGAKPILVTSLSRRRFGTDGRIQSDLVPYVEAVIQVAKTNHVPLVDLNARSIEQLNAIGPVAAVQFDRPSADPTKPDRTHLSEIGAQATAVLVARELQKVVPPLAAYFAPLPAFTLAAPPQLAPIGAPPVRGKPDFVVAADGSGQFKTLQDAVDAAPNNSEKRVVILIKPGRYKTHLVIPKEKANLKFVGEDAEKTVLTNDWHVKTPGPDGTPVGTIGSASTVVSAPDFQAENLTFENNAPHVAQALAIYVQGDRAEFRNCRFLGWQDTIRLRSGRQYFRDCLITGRTDFIYGAATAFFDRCHIHVLEPGWITAANTPQDHPYGFVFSNCKISGEPGVQTSLGRPWRPFAATVWLNTEMEAIAPEGWNNWGNPDNEKTTRYAEYASKTPDGEPVDVSKRVAWAKNLTIQDAALYTPANVLGDWKPAFLSPSPTPLAALHPVFVLAGDSTVTDDAGWGAGFKALLKPEIALVNLARGGRSSRSFRAEGLWQKALDLAPQYVLIQFGHNDEPGHGPDRESDAATTYKQNIERYVDEARAKNIVPVLVTPMTRRQFDTTGKIHSSLAPYALAVRRVAQEKHVPLVDLHTRSLAFFDALGPNKSQVYAPKKSETAFDGTHLNAAGSAAIAPLVADELKKAVPALANDFR